MKKRYLALLLACFMTVPLTMSACGRLADEIVRDDDEDKDDKEDDDDEEEEEEEIVYIEAIDEDDLEDQIETIVKNRDDWVVTFNGSAAVDYAEYCVADLDHNGRAEIISVTHFDYGGSTEVRIFEVDEKGKGLKEAKWKYKGVEVSSDTCPDFYGGSNFRSYYDKKENVTHFLMDNYFDNGNDEFGVAYCDLSYSEGKAVCLTYGAYVYGEPVEYVFDDGTEVDNEADFLAYLDEYPKRRKEKQVFFGLFADSSGEELEDVDDESLIMLLTDSYAVYTGDYSYEEFDETYNEVPDIDLSDTIEYEDIIGRWILYSSNDGFDTEYYDEDSEDYIVIEFCEDQTALLKVYMESEEVLSEEMSVYESSGYWVMDLYDREGEFLSGDEEYVQFIVMDLSYDGQDMSVYNVTYDYDGFINEAYQLEFIKDKNAQGEYDYSLDRYIGEWELVSSEIEGDVTYYESNGSFNATLFVYEDGTVSLKEYRNGKLDLEINDELSFNSIGLPYFEYSDKQALSDPVASETYELFLNIAGYDFMDVYLDFYDKDGAWLGGCCLNFEKTYG